MMNEQQTILLQLLKEIDQFCSRHDITYYCAAGTVLGAVRHGGFIPWDDDIDILMTRQEFMRFVQRFQLDGPNDRTIEFYEGNHEHRSTVARYLMEGTTMFCHYHIVGRPSAGILIDIFILDPIPDDLEAQREHLAKFFVYSDLVQETLTYANRLPEQYDSLVDRYRAMAEEKGREAAIRAVSDEIFTLKEASSGHYMLRWGSLPFVYPKEMFGEPERIPFEDMTIPVPCRWPEYLAVHYGSRWMDIPYVDGRDKHSMFYRTDTDYHRFFDLRDRLFDQEDLIRMHEETKAAWIASDRLERAPEAFAADLQVKLCQIRLDRSWERTDRDAERLFEQERYEELIERFRPYIDLQTSLPFMGSLRHIYYYHWMYPWIVPLEDRDRCLLIRALLYTGRLREAEKLLGIAARSGQTTGELAEAAALLEQIRIIAGLFYRGEHAACLCRIRAVPGHEKILPLKEYFWMAAVREGLDAAQAARLQEEAGGPDAAEGILKARADWLWQTGKREEAAALYAELMQTSRNGMFLQDIRSRGISLAGPGLLPDREPAETELTGCLRTLLEEIADICDRDQIPYVLGEGIVRRIHEGKARDLLPGDLEVYVDSRGARRLQEAIGRAARPGRRLLSWEQGDRLEEFGLRYVDTGSIYCDVRYPGEWQVPCPGIGIRILLPAGTGRIRRRLHRKREETMGLLHTEAYDRHKITEPRQRRSLYRLQGASEVRKAGLRRRCFRSFMREGEGGTGGPLFCYTNGSRAVPRKHSFPADYLSAAEQLVWGGRSYRIPRGAGKLPGKDVDPIRTRKPSIFILQGVGIPWENFREMVDLGAYAQLDLEAYGAARKRLRELDRGIRKAWGDLQRAALR